MKITQAICVLLACLVGPACAQPPFTSHPAFYAHVAQAEHWVAAFERRQIDPATPVDRDTAVRGLSSQWASVRIARDALLLNGRRLPWQGAQRAWGRATPVAIDIEIAQVWEQPGQPRLCIESPAGHSGSAARWQHVLIVERTSGKSRPRLLTWSNPYASCQAMFRNERGQLFAGVFEMRFESERHISAAAFELRELATGVRAATYQLTLSDPRNAFEFTAEKAEASSAPR